jgi:hypothetical protein
VTTSEEPAPGTIAAFIREKFMPTFSGQSPVISPFVGGFLNLLFKHSLRPGQPEDPEGRKAKEAEREEALSFLNSHFACDWHGRAVEVIRRAWESGEGVGLYLRNFELGSRVLTDGDRGHLAAQIAAASRGAMIATHTNLHDFGFQKTLTENFSARLNLVGILNPAYEDPRREEQIPKLQFADDTWRDVVAALIPAARVIFLYFSGAAPGVLAELELIRRLGRQRATVIVRQEVGLFTGMPREAPPAPDLSDFPHVMDWREGGESEPRLTGIVEGILAEAGGLHFSPEPPAPARPLPPRHIVEETARCHHMLSYNALRWFDEGSYDAAEDALTGCLALSFWNGSLLMRAYSYRNLLAVQLAQPNPFYINWTVSGFLHTLEQLVEQAPPELSEFSFMLEALAVYLAQREQDEGTRHLAGWVDRLKSTKALGQ